ncbi:hypothetical protein CYANOKiyG1_32050 [Okeania sp. KiyG1]|nr:hypothetical protein CYANOKiyG1_32050 [Okeania sp. KiyG1]
MVGGVEIWQWRSDGTFFYTELSGLDMIEKLITALSQEVEMPFQLSVISYQYLLLNAIYIMCKLYHVPLPGELR